MSAIPQGFREAVSPDEFRERVVRLGLCPCAARSYSPHRPFDRGPCRLFVAIPGLTEERKLRGVDRISAEDWLERLGAVLTDRGERALKIVGDARDERHISVAWTAAGRAWQARLRRWERITRRDPALVSSSPD